jgi:uncharacterized membrane protein YecN with MAPEG domain
MIALLLCQVLSLLFVGLILRARISEYIGAASSLKPERRHDFLLAIASYMLVFITLVWSLITNIIK